jgi:hypothetical protein
VPDELQTTVFIEYLEEAAREWEEKQSAQWARMRAAWEAYSELVREREALGYNGMNPHEKALRGARHDQ